MKKNTCIVFETKPNEMGVSKTDRVRVCGSGLKGG